jgi:hypothetical protein
VPTAAAFLAACGPRPPAACMARMTRQVVMSTRRRPLSGAAVVGLLWSKGRRLSRGSARISDLRSTEELGSGRWPGRTRRSCLQRSYLTLCRGHRYVPLGAAVPRSPHGCYNSPETRPRTERRGAFPSSVMHTASMSCGGPRRRSLEERIDYAIRFVLRGA